MNQDLLTFYFEKTGFKKISTKSSLTYRKGKYSIVIPAGEGSICIYKMHELVYQTGKPQSEPSVVKWCNILIRKHETQSH